jgi:hypothetical protein
MGTQKVIKIYPKKYPINIKIAVNGQIGKSIKALS